MIILGICAYYHDASAALVVDGTPVAFAEEERFNRRKHTGEFPTQAIRFCLESVGANINDVDEVAFYYNPRIVLKSYIQDYPFLVLRYGLRAGYQRGLWTASFLREIDLLRHRLGYNGKITWVDHHIAHAAYVYYLSSFDHAAILTIDSIGERATTTISIGQGASIQPIDAIYDPDSLGYLYGAVTQHLGYKRGDGEGTVMALASFGDSTIYNFDDVLKIDNTGKFKLNLSYVARRYSWADGRRLTPSFENKFCISRTFDEPITEQYKNLAASLQSRTEQAVLALARRALKLTGCKKLCMSGGVALNSVINAKVRTEIEIDDLYIAPSCNDAGTALGAAMYKYSLDTGLRAKVSERVFLGPEFSDSDILDAIRISKMPYDAVENPAQIAARLLSQGKIIGWFQGRMESGPRTLGNRSILADPSIPSIKHRINSQVKFREAFRPFAPSVLYSHQHEWFSCGRDKLPYMLEVVDVLPNRIKEVSSISHVDGTARIQSVCKDENPKYHALISAFNDLKGIPMVLNTSFNIKGEPIVCSPSDALRCFFGTGLDALFIGNFLLRKRE